MTLVRLHLQDVQYISSVYVGGGGGGASSSRLNLPPDIFRVCTDSQADLQGRGEGHGAEMNPQYTPTLECA